VETLNVKKSVNQSQKAIHAGCQHRNKAVSIRFQKLAPEKVSHQTRCQMVYAPDSGVDFMAPISGTGFWSMCHWLNCHYTREQLLIQRNMTTMICKVIHLLLHVWKTKINTR